MAKRVAQTQQKHFNFDLESLLISDLSPDDQNDSQSFSSESYNHPKKFKTKNSKPLPANKITTTKDESEVQLKEEEEEEEEETEEGHDVTNFFENVGNDFNKSMQLRKSKLGQFTEAAISLYQSKFFDLMKKQETEIQEFKQQTVHNISDELNKCEDEFKKLKLQESKLMKIFEQQMKQTQKAFTAQSEWLDNFRKLHKCFIQKFEDLKDKHKNETQELKKSVQTDLENLQNRFLLDSKKDEVQTMKKYFSTVYF